MTVKIEKSKRDRGGFRLTTELAVAAPLEEVFDFFADAFQLETITPPWLHFTVQTQRPIAMRQGTEIDYKLRLHGLPIRWRSTISLWDPPCQFVDEQVQGPYRHWRHRHTFERVEGGTRVCDTVDYAVPLGFIMHRLLVRRDLTTIFKYRRDALERRFAPLANDQVAATGAEVRR